MRTSLSYLPLALLFLASIVPSSGQSSEAAPTTAAAEAAPALEGEVVYFDLNRKFSLNCSGLSTDHSVPLVWEKNGTAIEKLADVMARVVLLPAAGADAGKGAGAGAGVQRELLALADKLYATDADVGNYTCRAGAAARAWQLRARPISKLPADVNVVEGQKLKIVCKVIGRPYPVVKWAFSNVSESMVNATDVTLALGERASVGVSEQGVAGAELTVEVAQRSDAGWFRCAPADGVGTPAVTRLRVKDMYAALWPFLGICAEVFVLCTIILVYEKRRTKPELDDSDTDNHDQKKS